MSLAEKLRALYLVDQKVRGLRSRLDTAIRRVEAQQRRLDQFERQRDELAEQLKVAQARGHGFETESQGVESRIAKLREQMNSVTTNKEYSALLVEVNTLKAEKSKFEDQALEQMSRADILTAELKAADEQVDSQRKIVAGAEKEVEACRNEVGETLEKLQAERDAAAAEIPEPVVAHFDRVAEENDGDPMACVTEESRRHMEYACGGCYMGIPVERLNSLMVGRDEIVLCPSCGRILYLDPELKSSLVK